MAANRSLIRSVLRNLTICMLCWFTASGAGGVAFAAPPTGVGPLAITLDLSEPVYGACGDTSINGYVGTNSGVITRMAWDWGDGVVADSWFPAAHRYAANGSYLVHVTAYASTGETRTEDATAVVTNAGDPGCGPSAIVLDLHAPEYGACGDVSINGYVHTDDGEIRRLSWDWGDGVVADSSFPAVHHYAANGNYLVQVTAYASTGDTRAEEVAADVGNADAANCGYTLRLHPAVIVLHDNHTSETVRPELRDPDGRLVSLVGRQVTFTSSNPTLVQVDVSGTVNSTGFGEAQIEASVEGFPRRATSRVVAGRFQLKPAIQLLSPDDEPTGALTLYIANADGTLVDLQGHTITFSGGNQVASVDNLGTVTALAPPQEFGDSPYINAQLDGRWANNASFTRVTPNTLDLDMNLYTGQHVAFRVADQVGPYPYGELMEDLQVIRVSDHAYRLEQRLAGATPFNGDTQFMVMDPGYEDGTVPCGLSGNPLRLGVAVDSLSSCFGGEDWLQWGIMYHEMGHNFMVQQPFLDWLSGLSDPGDYSEGVASMLGIYAIDAMVNNAGAYGLDEDTVDNLSESWISITPGFARTIYFDELAVYEQDPDYAHDFTADILDGILTELHDDYGPAFFYRLLSAFVAGDEWRDLHFENEAQRLTFWVAACSAAAGQDLRSRFQGQWGFPADDDFYDAVYPLAQRLVARRDPAADAGPDHTIPLGQSTTFPDAAAFDWEDDPLTYSWQVVTRPAGSTATLPDPAALHPTFQPDRVGRYELSLRASDSLITGPGDTVAITASGLEVDISRSGTDAVLSWSGPCATCEVYEDGGNPYLTPATGTLLGAGASSFVHTNALAPPYRNHYYLVKATCSGETASNRTGVFHYSLTPGQ